MTQGSFNARLHVGGRGSDPLVNGSIGVPGGDVNGLPFIDATGALAASVAGVSFRHGRVKIGTTNLHFTAIVQQGENAFHVASDRADLSDFNNFFDTGDTLDGNGTIRLGAFVRPATDQHERQHRHPEISLPQPADRGHARGVVERAQRRHGRRRDRRR